MVAELVLKSFKGIGNLTFDNWYTSAKLVSLLTALDIPTIGTVRADHVGNAPILSTKDLENKEHGVMQNAVMHLMIACHCILLNGSIILL